jgi:HK97 gp10 family phage protein
MKTTVSFEGGKELEAALGGLPRRVSRKIVKDVLLQVGEPMRKRMARLAPRSPGGKGRLAASILITPTRKKRDLPTPTGQAVVIGPAAAIFYAFWVETGTARAAAHPFVRPAFDSEVQKVIEAIKAAIWVELAARGVHQRITAGTWAGSTAGGD